MAQAIRVGAVPGLLPQWRGLSVFTAGLTVQGVVKDQMDGWDEMEGIDSAGKETMMAPGRRSIIIPPCPTESDLRIR